MKCYNCGTEYEGGRCPKCGVGKPAYKVYLDNGRVKKHSARFYIMIIVIVYIVIRFAQFANTDDEYQSSHSASSTLSTDTPINYTKCDIAGMLKELDDNALRAENKYNDAYIEITGKLGTIDSDGKYIGVKPSSSDWLSFEDIQCYIQSEDQKAEIMKINRGDTVTVKGQIISIGEVLGYSMDIDEVKAATPAN